MKQQRIIVRVDANSTIGFGHLTRCCSIVSAIEGKFEFHFYSFDNLQQAISNILSKAKFQFQQIDSEEIFIDRIQKNDIVIIDGYTFSSDFQEKIKANHAKLIFIDDLQSIQTFADIVINPTPGIQSKNYKSAIYTQFFIGLRYAMLRPAFLELAKDEKNQKIEGSLFICFGGSDPLNVTKTALEAASQNPIFKQIHIVLGSGYLHSTLEFSKHKNLTIHHDLKAKEMADLMKSIEFAIVPCSGILLESLAAKMKIISGWYVENQQYVYTEHLKLGSFIDAQNFSSSSLHSAFEKLKSYKQKDTKLIDGKSNIRFNKLIQQLANEQNTELQLANHTDVEVTFNWASNPIIRKHSFSKDVIKYEEHNKWFIEKLADKKCHYFILTDRINKLGSIRFDINDNTATISYLIAPEFIGKGYGSLLLKKGLEKINELSEKDRPTKIIGLVMTGNDVSIKLFERFGFNSELKNEIYYFTKEVD